MRKTEVCAANGGIEERKGHVQRVLQLKLKEPNGLLRSRATSKEFDGCPAIGGHEEETTASSY
jgi:hypothetical protein